MKCQMQIYAIGQNIIYKNKDFFYQYKKSINVE